MHRRVGGVFFTVSFSALILGCTSRGQPVGSVSGTIKYKEKELSGAVVTFHGSNDRTGAATTDASGAYHCKIAPLGENKVSVVVLAPAAPEDDPAKGTSSKDAPPAFRSPLPEKYADPKTSGLKFEVKPGSQTYNIDLQ